MSVNRPTSDRPAGMESRPSPVVATRTFDEFYRSEYNQLVGLATVLSGNRSVAEDLVQDAFTEAHRRWAVVARYNNPEAWVRRVLVNKATSRGRRLATNAKLLTKLRVVGRTESSAAGAEGAGSDGTGPAGSDPGGEVWAAGRALPNRQAQVIALRYWNDLGIEQIAATLDCGTETVKTHLKRGRARLAVVLDDGGEG